VSASASSFARSFGRTARDYEHGRPVWPAGLVEQAARLLGLGPDAAVVDLAAGTGKLTRVLMPRFEHVVAVEPDGAMRALLEELVPEAETCGGTAEALPLADASVDAVFCAEAFHWFDGARALGEIARALRQGGGLVVVFSETGGPMSPPAGEALRRRMDALRIERKPARERADSGLWREAFASSPFEELREFELPFEHVVDHDGLLALFASRSWIATLPDDERAALLAELGGGLPEGEYRMPLRAHAWWTRLAE
jgi:SAM-dependent methyltransferase